MIRPTKYLDLNTCTLRVAAFILSELYSSNAISLPELDDAVTYRLGEKAKYNFLSALNFLFITGKINYDEKADAIILLSFKSEVSVS